ncbi:MAG: hypothetical protein IPI78_04925 [Chitinophagaceae bacterium]|nr:hypothetical protein [Chitinophagaceae bacterium]
MEKRDMYAQMSAKNRREDGDAFKDHVCTADCHDGQHLLAHGEKGHVCGDECKKMMDEKVTIPLKDHVCTKDCKDNKHSFAHGEKGHVCTDACKKSM